MSRIDALEQLARTTIGDGKRPNLYFVTDRGNVVTVTTEHAIAYQHWRQLAARTPLVESAMEDRLTGVLASVEPVSDVPGARLEVQDDTRSFSGR